ncbi:MAG TPA: spermidine/putrescine ABC transporter substrate-binding protein [Clostridiaceae bacterium]|nr:spermidine/putrescine ABC transporter substrate-binding protein [Clostridiaceae bacterium]
MKKILTLLLVLALLLPLIGCKSGADTADTTQANEGEQAETEAESSGEKRTLTVANWQGYGSDAEYATKQFEEKYNCEVVHQYYDSEEALLNMLRTGGLGHIDVCLPNMAYIGIGKRENLFAPLDKSKLENFEDLREDIREVADVKDEDGNILGAAWTWGTTSLGYNPDAVSGEINSWSALWDPAYKGKVAFFDDHTTAILIAALYSGEDPENPDLEKIKDALLELKENTRLFWSSYDSFAKPYVAGEVVMGSVWSGAATQLNATGEKIEYIYPEEGTIAWVDYWSIPVNAPNEDLAYAWINWMTSVEFQSTYAADLEAQPPIPANTKVYDVLSDEVKAALYIEEMPEKLAFQKELPPEINEDWLDLWNEIKAND